VADPDTHPRDFRIGFRVSITTLFVATVLVVGLTLVYFSFERATAISRSAAGTFIDRVAAHGADRIGAYIGGVGRLVDVVVQLPTVRAGAIADNPRLYALFAAMLRENPQIYSLYAGYDDGDFLEMDLIARAAPATREAMRPPEGAVFRLVTIIHAGETRTQTTRFLSDALATVGERQEPASYDPRQRPWYKDVVPGSARITGPYLFGSGQIGYTLRAPLEGERRGVAAGDILLGEIEQFLREQRLGETGIVFVFDDSGRVVAHPRMSELLKTQSGRVELPHLDSPGIVDIRRPLGRWRQGGPAQQFFTIGERAYVVAFRVVPSDSPVGINIAVVAPLDEFFGEIEAARLDLIKIAIAFVAAILPFAFLFGWMLSASLKKLAAQTDRIQRFELDAGTGRVHSIIREIDDLGRSVATMRTVVRTFSSFVPRRLVQQLVETGDAFRLGGTRRVVTIMFTDITGFTEITENADPEKVMVQTSRYLATLSEVVMANGGTVDKFVGDAVMAIWNAPSDDADHVAHACAAALACREANRRLNEEFEREGWPAYLTRFGIHTGEAVVGNIGSADRMNYTVLGATVNLAARLEPLNKDYGTEILVSEAVEQRVRDRFGFRFVDRVRPKGFDEPVEVFELVGEVPA
jgi:adenylate cyclase